MARKPTGARSKRRSNKLDPLARKARKLLADLPDRPPVMGTLPPLLGGPAEVQFIRIGPGWYGMCPLLFTRDWNLIAFVPHDVFQTIREGLHQHRKVALKVVTDRHSQELVTLLHDKA